MLAHPGMWVQVAIGAILLLFGRRLFWLVLGVVGFALTFTIISRLPLELGEPSRLVVSLLLGVVGAVLAVVLQKIALSIAGFAFGAYCAFYLLDLYEAELGNLEWLVAIAAGVLVAALASTVFDVALVVLSTFVGAGLVVSATILPPMPAAVLLLFLLLIGLSVQLRSRSRALANKND